MVTLADDAPFTIIAEALRRTIERGLPMLRSASEAEAARPLAPGKWSRKEIVGHLIDSAANNHQRFVRAQESRALVFPGYAQNHWVTSQRYNDREWRDLVVLLESYNRHLSHIMAGMTEDHRETPCVIGGGAPVTLGFLARDYVRHLQHHLTQLEAPHGS